MKKTTITILVTILVIVFMLSFFVLSYAEEEGGEYYDEIGKNIYELIGLIGVLGIIAIILGLCVIIALVVVIVLLIKLKNARRKEKELLLHNFSNKGKENIR